jgi:acyl-homoserine-lactone acylase
MNKNIIIILLLALGLNACGHKNKEEKVSVVEPEPTVDVAPQLVAFDPDGELKADIKWTTYGVPHITADNLQSLAFGSGYAYAKDNLCILADQIIKVRSERSKYFGADKVVGSGDSGNVISDFGYHALGVMQSAEKLYPSMSENSRALIEGYITGYNKYLSDTGVENLAPECANKPWVKAIKPQELVAYIFATSQLASGTRFLDIAFFANPGDGSEYLPYVGVSAKDNSAQSSNSFVTDINTRLNQKAQTFNAPNEDYGDLGSNGWGLGKNKTENGKGILLANPHFPHTGNLRFWQSQITIPGVLNVMGGALQGLPGIVNIGFNDHIAWTHTVSTSRRFVVYKLQLAENNRQQYIVDGEVKNIKKKTYYVEVKAGNSSVVLSKDFYYSHHGLMIETPAALNFMSWTDSTAFTLRDAAAENADLIDHWLAINMAKNLDEFQQAYKSFNGIPWVNTMYADEQGNAFYIDKTRVLNLNDTALALMRTDPVLVGTRKAVGFDILPGNTSLFEPNGLNSYEQAPKLLRDDFVQNSNNSYWFTNPAEPLSGYSILYGDDFSPLTLRTRMGLTLLNDSAGSDNKFSPAEVEAAWASNRAYLAEITLSDLLIQCQAQGNTPVILDNGMSINIAAGCNALTHWDMQMNKDSSAGHIFREFSFKFNADTQFTVPFTAEDPINTPNKLSTDASVLKALAAAIANVESSNFAVDANLGDIQFTEKTLADGNASGERFPWAGAKNEEGGFNVFASAKLDDTLYPIYQYSPVLDVETGKPLASGLSSAGYHINYGSSWVFVVNFTDNGPSARGILTYSQSSNTESEHLSDQNKVYSDTGVLRPLLFNDADIVTNTVAEMSLTSQ